MTKASKKILISGGSRGIGLATASILAEQGHQVLVTTRRKEAFVDAKKASFHIIENELSEADDFIKLFEEVNSVTGELDGIINNAGFLINKPFLETTDEDWLGQLNCNVMAPARIIKTLYPLLKQGSHVVNIGSMGGFQGSSKFPGLAAYSVTKGALSILSECLSAELDRCAVNCLCLGAVQTEMLKQAFPGFNAPVLPEQMGAFIADFCLNGQKYFNGKVLPVSLADPK